MPIAVKVTWAQAPRAERARVPGEGWLGAVPVGARDRMGRRIARLRLFRQSIDYLARVPNTCASANFGTRRATLGTTCATLGTRTPSPDSAKIGTHVPFGDHDTGASIRDGASVRDVSFCPKNGQHSEKRSTRTSEIRRRETLVWHHKPVDSAGSVQEQKVEPKSSSHPLAVLRAP